MAEHHPTLDSRISSDCFEVGYGLVHGVGTPAGTADTSWLGIPGPHAPRRNLVVLEIVDASRTTRQDHYVGAASRDADVQVGPIIALHGR